jgi:hypothetical protein
LVFQRELFELLVRGEIDTLIGRLAQGRQGDAAVEGRDAFFADNGERGVRGVSVARYIVGIRERVYVRYIGGWTYVVVPAI